MTGLRRGFTLLELLIAVAVLGLAIVLLDQGVAFGPRATATQQAAENRHGAPEAMDRAIRHLIEQADPGLPPEPPRFRGTGVALTLVSELPAAATGERERIDAMLLVVGDELRRRWTRRRHLALSSASRSRKTGSRRRSRRYGPTSIWPTASAAA